MKNPKQPRVAVPGLSLTAVALLLAAAPLSADILTFTPSNDTALWYRTTNSAWEATNFGSDPDMDNYLDTGVVILAVSYIQFDLSSIPAGSTVHSASLQLTQTSTNPGQPGISQSTRNDTITTGRLRIGGLLNVAGNTPQNWDESTLTFATTGAELSAGDAALDPPFAVGTNAVDLNDDGNESIVAPTVTLNTSTQLVGFVQGRVDDGGLITFMTNISGANQRGFAFASKENTTDAIPLLTLDVTVIPEPSTAAVLLGFGAMLFGLRRRR